MKVSDFIKSIKEHINPQIYTEFVKNVISDQPNDLEFTRFVCTTFDLDLNDRTRLLAIYLIFRSPQSLIEFKSEFSTLFDISDFDISAAKSQLNEEYIDVDSPSQSNNRTADLSIFEQHHQFLKEYKKLAQKLIDDNFFLYFDDLIISLSKHSQTLVDLEMRFYLEDTDAQKPFFSEIEKYREKLIKFSNICDKSKTDPNLRKGVLNYFNFTPETFTDLFDDGNHSEESLKQKFLRGVISLFYREYLELYPSSIPNVAPSGYSLIDEIKNHIGVFLTFQWISGLDSEVNAKSSTVTTTPEIALATSNLGLITTETAPLLDFTTLESPFLCAETTWKHVDCQEQLLALATNAFHRGWISVFNGCYNKLDLDSRKKLCTSVANIAENNSKIADVQLVIIFLLLSDAKISKDFKSSTVSDDFVTKILDTLNIEDETNVLLTVRMCQALTSIGTNQSERVNDYFKRIYTIINENIQNTTSQTHIDDYEAQMKSLLEVVLPGIYQSSCIDLLDIDITYFINHTSFLISDYFDLNIFPQNSQDYIQELVRALVVKFSELPVKESEKELDNFKKNLQSLLHGRESSVALDIASSVIGNLDNQYEKYCAYLIFLLFINDKMESQKDTMTSEKVKEFITLCYQAILAKKTTFSVLAMISRSAACELLDCSLLTFGQNIFINPAQKRLPNLEYEYALRATTLLCNKSSRTDKENEALVVMSDQIAEKFQKLKSDDKSAWFSNFNMSCLEQNALVLAKLFSSICTSEKFSESSPSKLSKILVRLGLITRSTTMEPDILDILKHAKESQLFITVLNNTSRTLRAHPNHFEFKNTEERCHANNFLKSISNAEDCSPPAKRRKIGESFDDPESPKEHTLSRALNFTGL